MKNFLKYVGVFSASLILLIIGVEYMLRQVPNALAFKNVHSLEYFGDTRFNDEDFYDGNHLSSDIGAIKFTKILKDDILTDL